MKTLQSYIKSINESYIVEGGTGGHMAHVFDIPWVKTGKDLMKAFDMSTEYVINSPAAVKIDGVNSSIRLISIDNKKQFVLDRGSNKELDVRGITKDDLMDRFGPGHGFLEIGANVLDIFNSGLSHTSLTLKKLGLFDNPNILFNIEYVEGKTNVKDYNNNFIAIHGIMEIKQVTPRRRAATEIAYDEKLLLQFINELQPSATKLGFEVVGTIPTILKTKPNLKKILDKEVTIVIGDQSETFTLKSRLNNSTIPTGMFTLLSGKKVSYFAKDILKFILGGGDLNTYADSKYHKDIIDAFCAHYYTMIGGEEILNSLDSKLGPVGQQEGIVIRDPNICENPYKITGSFILSGLESTF